LINKIWKIVKEKFLTKEFIIFCIIGVINTAINFIVMKGTLYVFDKVSANDISTSDSGFIYYLSMAVSTLLAFVIASIFSYFANAKFTYKQEKRDKKTFVEAMIAFILRFALTYVFTLLIWWLMLLIFKMESDPNGWFRTIANLIASIAMIPPFYIVLGIVFKRAKIRVETSENNS